MTRINAGIPPHELNREMLLAEHREIKRIPNNIKKGKAKIKNIPNDFRLGPGHVKFFYDKLKYLHNRYLLIHETCLKRKYDVTDFSESFMNLPEELYNDWTETEEAKILLQNRIKERLNEKLKK